MKTDVLVENHQKYQQRLKIFKDFGYDIEYERNAIFEQAQPIQGSILEIGTGKGHFAIALALNGYRFITVDKFEEEQKYAKMNLDYLGLLDQVDFCLADAGQLTFDNDSFDTIFAVNVFHHLESPYDVLDEVIRVLRPAGKIVVSDFSKKGMKLIDKIHRQEGRQHPQSRVSVNDIAKYLEKQAFRVEKHRTIFQETIVARRRKVGEV